jgi:2-oxoglutarate dehydrogenase E2 component (dihydrolipoamide succinyltransferase)
MEQVLMPQLGETVTEGTIVRWMKAPGDQVAADDVLFEVSTDKVDTEVPSAHAGVLREIYVAEGVTVAIGTLLAIITATADEQLSPAALAVAPVASAPTPAPSAVARPAPVVQPRPGSATAGFLSPVVARLLHERGLSAEAVTGSGRDGRITRADVEAASARPSSAPEPVASAPRSPASVAGPDDDVVELSRARRATAENMMRSLAVAAHTLVVTEVDYARVDEVRRSAGLSFLPFVARAVIESLRAFPNLNASMGHDELIVHRRIHLGIAVDVDFSALVVPVIRDADGLRLSNLSQEIAAMAARARGKRLSADDLAGGTFTITNVGAYGTVVTAPIINQPQVAILSSDGVRMKPVAARSAQGDWTVAVHPVGNLSLSFDHRANDGAYAAAFLARVRDLLETRDWMAER